MLIFAKLQNHGGNTGGLITPSSFAQLYSTVSNDKSLSNKDISKVLLDMSANLHADPLLLRMAVFDLGYCEHKRIF